MSQTSTDLQGQAHFVSQGTILLCDIVRLDEMYAGQLSPIELVELMRRHLDYVLAVIGGHEGTVSDQVGDAVIAYWLETADGPTHADRAFMAGRHMLEGMPVLLQQQKLHYDLRVTIGTGELAGQEFGPIRQFQVIGKARNLMDRIERVAVNPGPVLCLSRHTADLLADSSGLQHAGMVEREGQPPLEILEWRPPPPRTSLWARLTH